MTRKPDFCPFIYTDGVKLFLEFDQMVLDFVFTEAGLHKALKHIPRIDQQPGYISGGRNINGKAVLRNHIARRKPEVKIARGTASGREVAKWRDLLKTSEGGEAGLNDIVRKLREGKIK